MERGSLGEVRGWSHVHMEGSGPETVEKHLIVLVKFQIIKMRKLAILVLQKLLKPINNCTKRTSQAYRDESECAKVCKTYSHTWLNFPFQNTPHFTGMETEAKKGQLTYQKASRQGNQTSHFQSKHLFCPTILLLSDVTASYRSLSNPQIQVCLIGMRIMIREIWPALFHVSTTWAKRETLGMTEKILSQVEIYQSPGTEKCKERNEGWSTNIYEAAYLHQDPG